MQTYETDGTGEPVTGKKKKKKKFDELIKTIQGSYRYGEGRAVGPIEPDGLVT